MPGYLLEDIKGQENTSVEDRRKLYRVCETIVCVVADKMQRTRTRDIGNYRRSWERNVKDIPN